MGFNIFTKKSDPRSSDYRETRNILNEISFENRLKSIIAETTVTGRGEGNATSITSDFATPPDVSFDDYAVAYETMPWFYAAVNTVAYAAARAPFRIYRKKRILESWGREEVTTGLAYNLLQNPNPSMTSNKELIVATFSWQRIAGNAYWAIVPSDEAVKRASATAGGQLEVTAEDLELWCLRPDWIKIVPDKHKLIKGYVYGVGKVETGLTPDQMIHFKLFHPRDPYYGLSPIGPLANTGELDIMATETNKRWFKQGGRPDIILSTDKMLAKQAKDEMIKRFKERVEGYKKSHQVIVLDQGLQLKDSSFLPRDMEFEALKRISRGEVLSVYGVPPTLVGFYQEGVNRSVADIQRTAFWEDTMMPMFVVQGELITDKYINKFHKNLFGEFDTSGIPALEESRTKRSAREIAEINAGVRTRDEFRLDRNLSPFGGSRGEGWWGNSAFVPLIDEDGEVVNNLPVKLDVPVAGGNGSTVADEVERSIKVLANLYPSEDENV